jgi:hypothetical protein
MRLSTSSCRLLRSDSQLRKSQRYSHWVRQHSIIADAWDIVGRIVAPPDQPQSRTVVHLTVRAHCATTITIKKVDERHQEERAWCHFLKSVDGGSLLLPRLSSIPCQPPHNPPTAQQPEFGVGLTNTILGEPTTQPRRLHPVNIRSNPPGHRKFTVLFRCRFGQFFTLALAALQHFNPGPPRSFS